MKKILIGTHNKGKFKEIAFLISKKFKKISPATLKIKSPQETGNTFLSNSKLKVKFFSKFVNYPVISDDSGLWIFSMFWRFSSTKLFSEKCSASNEALSGEVKGFPV